MGLGVSGSNDEGSFSASISSEMSKGVTNGSRYVRMDEMIEMTLKKVMFKTLKLETLVSEEFIELCGTEAQYTQRI